MEAEDSLPCSQEPATGSCPEAGAFSSHLPTLFPKGPSFLSNTFEHFVRQLFVLFQLVTTSSLCGWKFYILIISHALLMSASSKFSKVGINLILFFDFRIISLPHIKSLYMKLFHRSFNY
jgi:hypothetical protein